MSWELQGSSKQGSFLGMAKKFFFKPAGLVFLGFIRFFRVLWVLLLLALPIIGFYWCLLVFSPFLNEFLAIFDFCPFELFLILALFITRFHGVLLDLIGVLTLF